jgi:hypothetical protein
MQMVERAKKEPQLRMPAGLALAKSGDPAIARWVLSPASDGSMSPNQRNFLAQTFLGNDATRDIAAAYLLDNFDAIAKASGGGGIFSARAAGMFNGLCTNEQADLVDAKLRPVTASKLNLDRVVETIRTCARFRAVKADAVTAAFAAMR